MSNEGQPPKRRRSAYKRYKRTRDEHRVVYERHHGPIPLGYDVHHKDGDKWNNDPDNLEALPKIIHRRLHAGWKLIDEAWWKPCTRCREHKPLTEFHRHGGRIGGKSLCKPCNIFNVNDYAAKKKALRLLELLSWSVPEARATPSRLGYVCI